MVALKLSHPESTTALTPSRSRNAVVALKLFALGRSPNNSLTARSRNAVVALKQMIYCRCLADARREAGTPWWH